MWNFIQTLFEMTEPKASLKPQQEQEQQDE